MSKISLRPKTWIQQSSTSRKLTVLTHEVARSTKGVGITFAQCACTVKIMVKKCSLLKLMQVAIVDQKPR